MRNFSGLYISKMSCLTRNSGICVVYQKDELSAGRMYLARPIIDKYIADNGIRLDRNSIYYLEISSFERRRPCRDFRHLFQMSKNATVFITHLNSTSIQYLQILFFNDFPETVLISSVSTSTSLTGIDNLLRYQAPDLEVQKIYLYNILKMTGNCVVIYQTGVYYEDLSLAITEAAIRAGVPTLRLNKTEFDLGLIGEFVDPIFTIIFMIDDPLTYVELMRQDPQINLKSFQILISDAGVQQLTSDPVMLAYLELRLTRLLQSFINPRQLALADEYENYINDPLHPVSANIALLFICFDWAVLVTNTALEYRSGGAPVRLQYLNNYLDQELDNIDNIYGGYTYIPDALLVNNFYYVYGGLLYVGQEVLGSSSSTTSHVSVKSRTKSSKSTFCHNVGICVLYDAAGVAAERSFEVRNIIDKYIADTGTKIRRNRLQYLELTAGANPVIDRANLEKISRTSKTFVSALGTSRCDYLAKTFFNDNLECLHVNSFSTAASLSELPNLARYQTPDVDIVRVYMYQIRLFSSGSNCVLVYSGGPYSTDLSAQILAATTAAGIPTLRILLINLTMEILNQFTDDNFTIVYILDSVLAEIERLRADPEINLKNFQILVSDSAAGGTTSDPGLLAYLYSRTARVVQAFISDRQLAIQADFEQAINNPRHPVSSIISFFLACFDWAVLVTNTRDSFRLKRQLYMSLELDRFLNNTVNVYGTFRYVPDALLIDTFFFLYAERLYVGIRDLT